MPTYSCLNLESSLQTGLIDLGFEEPSLNQFFSRDVHAVDPCSMDASHVSLDSDGQSGHFIGQQHLKVPFLLAWWENQPWIGTENLYGALQSRPDLELVESLWALGLQFLSDAL